MDIMKTLRLTEGDVLSVIAGRYQAPEWAFLTQVRSGTGLVKVERYADAVALNCYPSRGMELHGFEVKVSVSDWRRELRDPEKSSKIQSYCDRWWVAAPEGVVKKEELPPTWGLLEVTGAWSNIVRPAPKLTPVPLDRKFLASVLRAAARLEAGEDLLNRARAEGAAEERKRQEKLPNRRAETAERRLDELSKMVDAFTAASGLRISPWDAGRIGAAVTTVLERGPEGLKRGLTLQLNQLESVRDLLQRAIAEMENGA